jgi:hypothetical protein
VGTPILFSPENVRNVLVGLPSVAAFLPDPAVEGEPSDAFPGVLRKTEREVYRWIANTHYEHLAEAVMHLERVYAAGCTFGSLLSTRDREQFVSLTAEVLVADDFLRRGYEVQTVQRSDRVRPDLLVGVDGLDVAVEVYSPRELLAVDAWVREVSDLLNYVDVKASYASTVQTELEKKIPPDRTPLDPWAPAKMLDETGDAVLAEITRDVEDALNALRSFTKAYRHLGTPLLTTVELDDVERAPDAGPLRRGTIGYPGFSRYSPAGVFRRTVERSQRKARRRQTQGVPAAARVLVVYLMGPKSRRTSPTRRTSTRPSKHSTTSIHATTTSTPSPSSSAHSPKDSPRSSPSPTTPPSQPSRYKPCSVVRPPERRPPSRSSSSRSPQTPRAWRCSRSPAREVAPLGSACQAQSFVFEKAFVNLPRPAPAVDVEELEERQVVPLRAAVAKIRDRCEEADHALG